MSQIRDRKKTLGISVVLLAVLLFTAPELSPLNKDKNDGDSHPRVESSLWQLYQVYFASGKEAARTFARQHGLVFENGRVQIVAETDPEPSVQDLNVLVEVLGFEIEALGGRVETSYRHMVQNSVPIESLGLLADFPGTHYLRPPLRPIPLTVSEGVDRTGADLWQGLVAYRGGGQAAKVCVLDVGFQGYETLLGTELPASTEAVSFRADGDIEANNPHGTACAEIVHDMAPNAQLVLVNFGTDVEQHKAVEWLVSSGVEIISYSSGWLSAGAGDGTGPICEDVNTAQKAGILWISAAGNSAERHWQEKFRDKNGNDWHDFSRSFKDEGEFFAFYVEKNEKFSIWLNWDDWGSWDGSSYSGSEGNDYDLYLYNADFNEIASSKNKQTKGALPIEGISQKPKARGWRYIRVHKRSAPRDCRLELFFTGAKDLEHVNPYGSLNVPADSPYALAVGATSWVDDDFHVYTSRGPTSDGRIKPDLVAPSGVSTETYGKYGFYGTSASAAHVAGAVALLMEKSLYSMVQILEILSSRALDLGPDGKDNLYGQGRLKLDK
ncbi:MAG: S8 family serine peptidase [Candidatus Aminicenantes bacterium]|nr:S8 family serine peptidase [Candidatus Aminicenantes bacterium]